MKKGNYYFVFLKRMNTWIKAMFVEYRPKSEITTETYQFRGPNGDFIVTELNIEDSIMTLSEQKVYQELEESFAYNVENVQIAKRIVSLFDYNEQKFEEAVGLEKIIRYKPVFKKFIKTYLSL